MSITKELDELGTLLAEIVARDGEESRQQTFEWLTRMAKIVRRNWPDKLKQARRDLKRLYADDPE